MSDDDKTNVIPEDELAMRRKVSEACDAIAAGMEGAARAVADLFALELELGGPTVALWVDQVLRRLPEEWEAKLLPNAPTIVTLLEAYHQSLHGNSSGAWVGLMSVLGTKGSGGEDPLRVRIDKLLDEAEKLAGDDGKPVPDQAPALECAVMLKPGQVVRGVLSRTEEGTLKMLTPETMGHQRVMVEQFFCYDDVISVAVIRQVKTNSPLVRS
jgi:hypothetical protein